MKQTDKKSSTNNQNQTKRPARSESRENKVQSSKTLEMTDQESTYKEQKLTTSLEKVSNDGREESDSETVTDSVSSSGDSRAAEDEKVEIGSRAPQKASKKDPSDSSTRAQRVKSERELRNSQTNTSSNISKKTTKSLKKPSNGIAKQSADKNSKGIKIHPKLSPTASVTSEGVDDQTPEEPKEVGILDDVSNGAQSFQSDDETADVNENIEDEAKRDLDIKIGEMEIRLDKLEEELREVAALEISLYSIVPEHGSSAHKVHTPARRLSRLYIHAGHHFSHGKRATIAKNTTSGLVLIAKSCGNDVSRLTFWWSNTVVLREIITQAFSSSCQSSLPKRVSNLNGASKQSNKPDFMEFIDDWQETRTFASALEKVESWIFSRIIESIWWQTLTPKMQSLAADTNTNKTIGKLLGPALGDQQQGNFSINLWRIAFHDAFKRLCPVRAGGHDCGCLPVLSRMVMEHCVARLDVAMFNAILRESAHEMPTDPVSDPIVESRVLPIPAGDLSFGSGAQLKNAVGNWSRWLTDWFGMDTDDDHTAGEDNDLDNGELKCFHLLNALSDLLMLPKDMLMDRSVRTEVCPSISLPLLKRILCNFTPDEFCPDPVPGAVLEAVNAEYMVESRLSGDNSSSFPYAAAQVTYKPPSSIDIAQKVSETGSKSELSRSASIIQRKGYTSDEELQELDSPLSSIIDKLPSSPSVNERYELLREVWLS